MKFSCAIFFFVLTIAAQFQHTQTAVSAELAEFKRTLDDASNALQDVEESPALSGNVELQRQRRKSIDDLLQNLELDLNLDLEREALDFEDESMHPLQGRATKNDNKNNNENLAKKTKVNDQLNDLVRANSRFQNLHRQLLNTFHSSNTNLKIDDVLQKSMERKGSKSSETEKATKVDTENNTYKEKDTNNYGTFNKNKPNKNTGAGNTNKDSYISNFNCKSNLGNKDSFNIDMDFGKKGSVGAPYSQTFSKLDSSDSLYGDSNLKSGRKDANAGSSVLTKAYISCKPLSSNTDNAKTDNAYLEFTSNLPEPQPSKASNTKSNLNTILLLEANNYRNALNAKNVKEEDDLEELKEKKVDPEMRKMLQKVDFPHFKLDFDSSMEDFVQKSKSDTADDDEPISYEKTIENIHFPSIVNDQFDLGRNDLSHEADYKLSKIEQEQSETRKGHARSNDGNIAALGIEDNLKTPWKRSSGFNAMDEIKLKTSTRLMAKGLGPSLPSYALSETQQQLQLDDAVKKLENNFNIDSEHDQRENDRHGSLVSQDILDWQERLKSLEDVEERSYEKLLNDDSPEVSKDQSDSKSKTNEVVLEPTYSILRKRRLKEQPKEDDRNLFDLMRPRRVLKRPCEDEEVLSQNYYMNAPDNILLKQLPDLTPMGNDKLLAEFVPAPAADIADIPTQDDTAPVAATSDIFDPETICEIEGAQIYDESAVEEEADTMPDLYKRCGEQKRIDQKDPFDKDGDVQMPIFKFKRDTSKDENFNGPKRRFKRIGRVSGDEEITGANEIGLVGISDTPAKLDAGIKSDVNVKQDRSTGKVDKADKTNDKDTAGQKVLRRRRRELTLTQTEVFNDDSLHVLNGSERSRRSPNKKRLHRVRRDMARQKNKEKKQAPEKSIEDDEARKNKQNAVEDSGNKLTRSELNQANVTDHSMGKRAAHAVDEIADNNSDNRKLIETAFLLSNSRNSLPAERCIAESQMQFDDYKSDNRKYKNSGRLFAEGDHSSMDALIDQRRESQMKNDDNDNRQFRDPAMLVVDGRDSIPDTLSAQRRDSQREIGDKNRDFRKFSDPGMLIVDRKDLMPGTTSEQRRVSQRTLDNYNRDDRKFRDAGIVMTDDRDAVSSNSWSQRRESQKKVNDINEDERRMLDSGDSIPVNKFADRSTAERIGPLTDAAVIAADRRTMNAARDAYTRNAVRDGDRNGEAREDEYRDLIGRLRRLSLRNRERERKQEVENNFSNSISEFGDQKFDNLKQFDQHASDFDGEPVDNLWYGHDPWEEDSSDNCPQSNDVSKCEGNSNKNQPNMQRTALTIKIENGTIKSIERKDEANKGDEANVVNEQTGNEEEEDDGQRENASFGWFGKGKSKTNSEKSDKNVDDGLVLKVNDQMLNCTAFNTLESFLKSVQQQQGQGNHGGGRQGGDGQGSVKQGTNGHGSAGHESGGSGGDRQNAGGHVNGGHSGGGHGGNGQENRKECEGRGHGATEHGAGGYGGGAQGDHGRFGGKAIGAGNDPKTGSGSGGGGDNTGAGSSGNGASPVGGNYGSTSTDGNSNNSSNSDAINMNIEIQPVTLRPQGSCGTKAMKLNITINASVTGDQKAKNFFGNGTIKVQSEDRERRGISFPQFEQINRYATKRKCTKPKPSCEEGSLSGKGAMDIVKSIFNMAKCNPQMKPLWASLKHNQQCMKKAPPQENGFEKMQKDDVNHIEDMVEQAMEAISDIIDDQVEQRSCIPLPPELKLFYDQILDTFESNSAEGVREKRANYETPFDEFSKEVRLIDPNQIEARSRIVKKLLRQYDDLPAEEQQQMVGVREDLLENLGYLDSLKEEQPKEKREQAQRLGAQEQQPKQRPAQQPEQRPECQQGQTQENVEETVVDTETDKQARWRRELLKKLEEEKDDDEQAIQVFHLPYTPEYVRLLKAIELMEDREKRGSELKENKGDATVS